MPSRRGDDRPDARRGGPLDARALARTLRRTFGLESLRTGQERVISRVLAGQDTMAVMPTGAGKSLCYQLPALHLPGTTVVVTPLIALMKDQADKLREAGVASIELNSTLGEADEADALDRLASGGVPIVFATPERMTDGATLSAMRRAQVALFVVDEAHCISQWGHDFRPAYLELSAALGSLGDPPVLALTATATDEVIGDIRTQLLRPSMALVQTGVYRPNLHYAVVHTTSDDERVSRAIGLLRGQRGAGIVYAATVRMAEALHAAFVEAELPVRLYHGRMRAKDRRESQEAFMRGDATLMVATNAFGLGVDKPDIRLVLHAQMPGSLEAYYQESGRGGRDGEPARCVLLYDLRDRRVQQFFLARRYPDARQLAEVQDALRRLSADGATSFEALRAAAPAIAQAKVKVATKLLVDAGAARRRTGGRIEAAGDALGEEALARLAQTYVLKSDLDREKLERMVFYAQTGLCRWRVLLDYFGESLPDERCGTCDSCRRVERRDRPASAVPPRVPARRLRRREFAGGDLVRVPRHGEGRVRAAAGDEVTVEFPNGDVRTFLRSYVRRSATRGAPVVASPTDGASGG